MLISHQLICELHLNNFDHPVLVKKGNKVSFYDLGVIMFYIQEVFVQLFLLGIGFSCDDRWKRDILFRISNKFRDFPNKRKGDIQFSLITSWKGVYVWEIEYNILSKPEKSRHELFFIFIRRISSKARCGKKNLKQDQPPILVDLYSEFRKFKMSLRRI